MRNVKILLLIMLLICPYANGQDYQQFYQQIDTAQTLANKGNIDSAIATYETGFAKVEYVNTAFLILVLKLAERNNDQGRIDKYKEQIKAQLKGTQPELKGIIDSLITEDQRVRDDEHLRAQNFLYKCLQKGRCDRKRKKFIKSEELMADWNSTDSSNVVYLLQLFDQNGFIGEEMVGSQNRNVITLLIHFDKDSTNSVLRPILKTARENGKVLPLHSAQIMDRHSFTNYNSQTYWTWPCISRTKFDLNQSEIDQILELREQVWIYRSELSQEFKRGYWILRNEYAY